MAKIYLNAQTEPFNCSKSEAEQINNQLANTKVEFFTLKNKSFKKSAIKAIVFDDESSFKADYDLNDEDDRKTIKDFEKELNDMGFTEYCFKKIYISTMDNNYSVNQATVLEYDEAKRKMKALYNLLERRTYAQKQQEGVDLLETKVNLSLINQKSKNQLLSGLSKAIIEKKEINNQTEKAELIFEHLENKYLIN